MILSYYVSDDYSIDDRTESNENYVELREVCVHKMLHQMINATLKWILKNKMKQGKVKSSIHIRCRWQNILTKLPEVIGQARNATMPFEARTVSLQMKF